MGPRRFRRGDSNPAPKACDTLRTLQWGRDVSVAVIRWNRDLDTVRETQLQWGRDVSVAVIGLYGGLFARYSEPLQWGRDVSVAVITSFCASVFTLFCFNGAATFPSR